MDADQIIIAHGSGGAQSRVLVRELFAKRFANPALDALGDAAVLTLPSNRIAFTTDAFVVQPLVFPGGDIGKLAVCGTVNDLAVSGAKPLWLSASFIIEEGTGLELLTRIADSMAEEARKAGVSIVAGDTKVVERSAGNALYITTAGIGEMIAREPMHPNRIKPGDAILINGSIADHGMAIMTSREGLKLESSIQSDCASLGSLAMKILEAAPDVRFMRDPTRGGLAALLNETVEGMKFGIEVDEKAIPINEATFAACEILGIDPLHVANEGKLVAMIPAADSQHALDAMCSHPLGVKAAIIGRVTQEAAGKVVLRTKTGSRRIVIMPTGELLPRIC